MPWVLERIPTGYHAIVADNGSIDGSADIAPALRRHWSYTYRSVASARPRTPACAAATAPIVCFMDADGVVRSADNSTGSRTRSRAGTADLVLGRRRPTSRAAWPMHARVGNAIVAARLRRSAGIQVNDLGPMRAARREALLSLNLRDRRCGYPLEMMVAAARAGWRLIEVDVDYAPRFGRDPIEGHRYGPRHAAHRSPT